MAFGERGETEAIFDKFSPSFPHRITQAGVFQKFAQSQGYAGNVADLDQISSFARQHSFRNPSSIVSNNRKTHRLGFDHDPSQSFVMTGGKCDNRASGVLVPELGLIQHTRHGYLFHQAQLGNLALQFFKKCLGVDSSREYGVKLHAGFLEQTARVQKIELAFFAYDSRRE